jgi:hypothetical protein
MLSTPALTPQQLDTFRVLGLRSNLASVQVLGHAMSSPMDSVRMAALKTLVERGGPAEMAMILEKIDVCHEAEIPLLMEHVPSLLGPIEFGLASKDPMSQQRSLMAIAKLQITSQFHHLVRVAQSPQDSQQIVAAELLVGLAGKMGMEARSTVGRKQDEIRKQLLNDLYRSMNLYHEHRVSQVFEAWLCASHWNDEAFRELFDPERRDQVAKMALKLLRHSHRPEIIDLIVGLLWSNAPRIESIQLLAERKDAGTLGRLADKAIELGMTPQLTKNLRCGVSLKILENFNFASKAEPIERRCSLLLLLVAADASPAKLIGSINAMLATKNPKAEAACALALRSLRSLKPELIVMALSDCFDAPDMEPYEPPPWKAELKAELEKLIQIFPMQPPNVRNSIEFAFSDFQCENIGRHLEDWPEPHLEAFGRMVRIAQRNYVEYLENEADSQSASKKIRVLKIIKVLGADVELIELVRDLLHDENEAVRIQAIYSIATGRNRRETIEMLRPMLGDADNGVKVAADLVISQLES